LPKKKNVVMVIGTGTIGEPLIGLLSSLKSKLGIEDVLFHKRTPLVEECAKVNSLISKGAKLVVDDNRVEEFKALGHEPYSTFNHGLYESDVIIDCTPVGNKNKDTHYLGLDAEMPGCKRFIAQGSEKGFGTPYAYGINDEKLKGNTAPSRFLQVVSCNTHAISRLVKCLSPVGVSGVRSADIVCIRRANDLSQDNGFTPSPTCGKHTDAVYGTHHARDVSDLFSTIDTDQLSITSSAMKVNSQYMHSLRFCIEVEGHVSTDDVLKLMSGDRFVTLTHHKTSNKIFSFGRDHGFYGRIYNQVVVSIPSLTTIKGKDSTRILGFAFTPQDGNSILSSVAACLYSLHDNDYEKYLSHITSMLQDFA
jgi:glyceraldehyde-3-phosphate dehydrogenase type II